MLDAVIIPAKSTHRASVIWLHGLGDSGHGFAPIVPELALPEELGVKFIFPHAPNRPVTINGGMVMRAWYDIKTMDLAQRADEAGVRESAAQVQQLIETELAAGVAANRIILAGFSQGGVVALHLLPRLAQTLAGVAAMSTYLCVPQKLADEIVQKAIPLWMAHGSHDPVVPFAAGEQAFAALQQQGINGQWHSYPMAHQVCAEQIADLRQWLIARLTA